MEPGELVGHQPARRAVAAGRARSSASRCCVLRHSFDWKCVSALAGITVWSPYFRLFPGTIKAPQVIELLEYPQGHIHSKLLIIWDGLPARRSRRVRDLVA
jgi:hypothetical protein